MHNPCSGAGHSRPDPESGHLSRRRDPRRYARRRSRRRTRRIRTVRQFALAHRRQGRAAHAASGARDSLSGVANRKLVSNGEEVKLVFSEGGLVIMTTGAALQDGSIGDIVRVRNSDSGVTVSGAVQPDGSVRVSGG
ncbi:MAG: flagellar basal body P-ring formation chaperone FlgA [Roseiarcus sp.]